MRQFHILFRFSKLIRHFVWLFPCFVRVANPFVNLKLHLCFITLRIKTKTISCTVFSSQIVQNAEVNIVVHWKFWRNYGSVSHSFSCTNVYLEYSSCTPLWYFWSHMFLEVPMIVWHQLWSLKELRWNFVIQNLKTPSFFLWGWRRSNSAKFISKTEVTLTFRIHCSPDWSCCSKSLSV